MTEPAVTLEQMADAYRAHQAASGDQPSGPHWAAIEPNCHACDSPATHQTQRPGTDDETAAHWDAHEQWIRGHGNPEYVADRVPVQVTVHRCDDPEHADPAYLGARSAALTAAATYAAAMSDLGAAVAAFTPEQIGQLAASIRQIVGAG